MTLGNIGASSAPLSWLTKGWSALRDHAHGAITHFEHEPDRKEGGDDEDSFLPGRWGIVAADVVDHDNVIEARLEIPGMSKEDLRVEFSPGQVSVSGEKHMNSSREKGGCLISERAFGHFRRTIPVPTDVDSEKVTAKYEDGVLVITIPKGPETSGSQISVS
jgi:HSP20 family molecular chaperone IbpA